MPTKIKKYSLYHVNAVNGATTSRVKLYDEDNKTVASILFSDSVNEPWTASNGVALLYFPKEDYANFVDMLRNESPVWFWPPSGGVNNIQSTVGSTYEAVGEEGEDIG